ncbi:pre-rRNA-processing protein esf2 [Striga asiatica]|uniref:Pre-rRNA-processing protein esf2 n=1 Tax=Striga asiatica TaxID=4170 RepID=A0A5A7PP47_STRAF|nr:pre-rRNA-processing protein esf2 [Striga asiatica]
MEKLKVLKWEDGEIDDKECMSKRLSKSKDKETFLVCDSEPIQTKSCGKRLKADILIVAILSGVFGAKMDEKKNMFTSSRKSTVTETGKPNCSRCFILDVGTLSPFAFGAGTGKQCSQHTSPQAPVVPVFLTPSRPAGAESSIRASPHTSLAKIRPSRTRSLLELRAESSARAEPGLPREHVNPTVDGGCCGNWFVPCICNPTGNLGMGRFEGVWDFNRAGPRSPAGGGALPLALFNFSKRDTAVLFGNCQKICEQQTEDGNGGSDSLLP